MVRQWRDRFTAQAEALADQLVAGGEFDGMRDAAEHFVLSVFPPAVGIRIPRENAQAIGDMNLNAIGPNNALTQAAVARAQPYMQWYEDSMKREAMLPGGFKSHFSVPDAKKDMGASDIAYFTLVTHSGVGYGDIYPITTAARLIVMVHLFCVILAVFNMVPVGENTLSYASFDIDKFKG